MQNDRKLNKCQTNQCTCTHRVNALSDLQLAKNIALGRGAGPDVKSIVCKNTAYIDVCLTLTCLLN